MNYEDLSKTLATLGERNVSIRRAVLMKFGCLLIADIKVPDDSLYPITEQENAGESRTEQEPPNQLLKEIFSALEKHPNIFDAMRFVPEEAKSDEEPESGRGDIIYGGKSGMIISGPLTSFRVHLPKTQHKYRDMDRQEHFNVISDGSIFTCYADVSGIPTWSNMGHEFRELAIAQIEKETPHKSPALGPCPIHPDVVVVFLRKRDAATAPLGAYGLDGDLFIVSEADSQDDEKVLMDLFWELAGTIREFYEVELGRNSLLDYDTEISSHFLDVSNAVSQLTDAPAWNVLRTRRLSREAKSSLGQLHMRLVEFQGRMGTFKRSQGRFLATLKNQPILSKVSDYFRDMTDPWVDVPEALAAALSFFEAELQLYGNVRWLLLASLIGAIVGSLITGILAHLGR